MCRDCDNVTIHRLLRDPAVTNSAIVAHVREHHDVNLRSPCGKTPLMTAAYTGRKELVEHFVALGCVIHATNEKTGDTAAHYAVHSLVGHVRQCSTLMILFEHGPMLPDQRNFDGFTPLELAEKYGNKEVGASSERL